MTEQLAVQVVSALARAGGRAVFGVPGGGPNLDVVGAAGRAGFRFVLAHGETAAAIMASTFGLLTVTPAAVIATRGPGAASLANGVAQATLDRFPLVAITDTVPAAQRHRVAHQRIDQRALFAPLTKRSATISPDVSEEALDELVGAAITWPFGAVHLDMDPTATSTPLEPDRTQGAIPADQRAPADRITTDMGEAVRAARSLLAGAHRPVVIVGAEAVNHTDALRPLLSRAGWPVLCTYQALGLVPTEGILHAGLFTNGASEAPVLHAADLIITIGLDLVEPIPAPWSYPHPIIRISSVPQEEEYLRAAVDLIGDPVAGTAALLAGAPDTWRDHAVDMRTRARAVIRATESAPTDTDTTPTPTDGIGPVALVDALIGHAALLGPMSVTVDAGAHFLAIMPLWPASEPRRVLISNGLATMGFAVPAAVGAALARPGEPVWALTGDGGLAMCLGELETIARLDLPITVIVFNDAALSLIEIKQQSHHGGPDAVRYRRMDFAAVATGCGLQAHTVVTIDELHRAMDQPSVGPRLIDVRVDPRSYPALLTATRG